MSAIKGSYKQGLAWKACHDPTVDEVFFGGGARSGKSVFLCAHEIAEAVKWPNTRGMIGRKEFTALHDSTLRTWWEVIDMFGYVKGEHFTWNGANQEVTWSNGSITMFRHLKQDPSDPNYTRLGSTAFTRVAIDEGDECEDRLVEMLLVRTGYNPPPHGGKVIVTGNPGEYWTKYRYVYNKKGEPITPNARQRVVLATVADNPDPVVRAEYTRRLEGMSDPYDKARLLHGDWLASPKTGREFFYAFDQQEHVIAHEYDPTKPLHITYDFNSAPYMTLLVAQIVKEQDRHEVRFIKEYCLEHPLSTTEKITQAFAKDLLTGCYAGHNAGLYYYGDYSGKSASTMARDGIRHNYDWVETLLGRWLGNYSCRLFPNPLHDRVRKFLNAIFSGHLPIRVTFHPDMHNTVRDVRQVKEDADGSLLKQMITDPATKVRYEKNGHCSQAMWYLVTGAFRDTFLEHGKVG